MQQTCTGLLTYSLTTWSRVLLEKLFGSQLVKKFPTFYGNQRLITRVPVHLYKLTFQLLVSFNTVVLSTFYEFYWPEDDQIRLKHAAIMKYIIETICV